MKLFTKSLQVLLIVVVMQQFAVSQTCPTINAQAGTGPSTTVCSGQCANLTATVVPVKATTSYSVGSATYSPFPFSGGTAAMGNIDDLWSATINIGFNFCYFGNTFNQLLVGSNGEITFDLSRANGPEDFSTTTILPNLIEHPGNTICVAYRDIDPSSGASSSVFTYTTGVAPCRKFVAYWSAIPTYSCTSQLATFQVVLNEGTNIIETYIQSSPSCITWQSGRGLMGIQNSTGTTAVAPSTRNTLSAWVATNEAWRYVPTGANTFTVNWTGPSGFTATGLTAAPCPTATSNYTATMNVSDCSGSITSYSSAVQVSVTPTPTLPIVATPTTICRGSSSVLSATGATSYSWMPGGLTTASISVSPTVTTTYTLTRTNGSCSSTQTISLIVNTNPTVTATSNPTVLCSSGSATLTSTGATSYTWNPGALIGNTVVVSPTVTTQYTVTGANASGCTATRTVNLLVSTTPTITASISSATACSGSSITLTASGASTYTWTPGNLVGATVVATPTVNTTYTVRGRSSGCIGTNTVNVTVTPGITFTATASPTIICRGGASTLTVIGASTYTWLPGALTGSTNIVTPTVTTIYTVTGSNGGACTATKFVTVSVSVPNITATRTPTAICSGSNFTLAANGGSTYTWAPGGMTGTPVVVSPTTTTVYTVTGTNTLGCTNTRTINLIVYANPTINISATSPSLCPGFSTTLTASGGTSYTWAPGSFTTTAITVTPSVSSTYSVTGINSSRCSTTSTINIIVTPSVTISPTSSPSVICSGNNSTLTATGASTYTWNPGVLTGSNVVVSPTLTTTYSVSGTDINGCNGTATLSVNVSTLNITATSNPTILCSASTATLTGTGASTYTWNPGALIGNTVVVTPAATTIYTVTGTNTLGCTSSQTLNLSVGITPTVTAGSSSSTVCAETTLTLSSSGAATYTWLPGSTTGSLVTVTPTTSTTYTVSGQVASGCIGTNTVFVFVKPVPTVTTTNTPLILCSGNTGTLIANGASTYTWSPGNLSGATVTVSPLVTTVYTVTGTSSLNCTGSATVNLKVTATPTISASSSPTVICTGSSATLTGTGAVSYTWNPGALTGSSVTITPSVSTTYTLTGDNGFGCLSTNTVALVVNASPSITLSASSSTICSGTTATLTANGATTYTWNPGALTGTTTVVSPSVNTTYTVTGDNGTCSGIQTISLIVNPTPTITLSASSNSICIGASATLTANGATSYTWNPSALTGTSTVVTPSVTTTYTVDGDNGTCIGTQTITLVASPTPTVTASASSNTICAGTSATLTANGAATYTWNPGALTGATTVVTPTATTTYTVDGDNGSGCVASPTITINVNAAPSISIAATPTILCSPGSVTLTASGANSYTWSPIISLAPSVVDIPTITTTYTVNGTDIVGCSSTQTITISVGSPTITVVATPTLLCEGSTANLTASGATTYTWNPGALTGTNIAVTPTTTTTYTVDGDNGSGCVSSQTITITVTPGPTVTATANPTIVCSGSSSTLTASGATTYTWMPMSVSGTSVVATPTTNTTYTLLGDNGGCVATTTIDVNVAPVPASVTATANGDITCNTATVGLTGNSTTAGVNYSWSGPSSYTSTTQNPTDVITAGDYTLTVTDPLSGCTTTATTTVLSNTIVAGLTATSSGSLGCNTSVTITATSTSTNTLNYSWSGPSSFTAAIQSPTTSVAGDYTVTVSDAVTGCSGTSTVTVGSNTVVPTFTATITPATCTGTISNNDGTITLTGFGTSDNYDLTQAATYTGSATYTSATPIPTTGIITNTLNNPAVNTPYTIRVFSANGCFKDTTLVLIPTTCATVTPNVLGMTKAVSTPSFVTNNVYNVTYTIVAINPSAVDLTNFSIVDDLSNTFPLPSSYGIISTPTITSLNSSLTINPLFNGTSQTDMLIPASSTLTAGRKDTIVFTVQINPNGFFGPFYNSAVGSGTDNGGIVLADSSNTGFAWDPDNDGDPTNNDTATVVTLNPNSKIGIAKSGSLSEVLADQTINVTYIFTIKNLGSDTINFVQVLDSLTIPTPAQFTIISGPTASGSLTANSNYNGGSDIGLLVANASKLSPGAVETITLVLNVTPNEVKSISNSAIVVGFGADGGIVRDTSQTGSNPDPNGNGDATEPGENNPTVLELPDVELFIPEVFTPDGDGKNDFFVMKGISGRVVTLTVFNRWGNKVYENNAYDNTWNGTPNVNGLIIGNNKLPQGTYYYIVEFEDGIDKPINGYVVLQY